MHGKLRLALFLTSSYHCIYTYFSKLDFEPDEAQALRGLELPLREFSARTFSALTHMRIPSRRISQTSTGSTSISILLRALQPRDAHLFEGFDFHA